MHLYIYTYIYFYIHIGDGGSDARPVWFCPRVRFERPHQVPLPHMIPPLLQLTNVPLLFEMLGAQKSTMRKVADCVPVKPGHKWGFRAKSFARSNGFLVPNLYRRRRPPCTWVPRSQGDTFPYGRTVGLPQGPYSRTRGVGCFWWARYPCWPCSTNLYCTPSM